MDRLTRQVAFLTGIDRLKNIIRRTSLCDDSRLENSAEHSWHLGMMAMVLAEYAEPGVDVTRVVPMVLVHDLVEIHAGDTFAYDVAGNGDREARERAAADTLFGQLPDDQGRALRALWEEFEAGETPDARYAVALDRLQPILANDRSGGGSWRDHDVSRAQVMTRMRPVEQALPAFWPTVLDIVDRYCAAGLLRR